MQHGFRNLHWRHEGQRTCPIAMSDKFSLNRRPLRFKARKILESQARSEAARDFCWLTHSRRSPRSKFRSAHRTQFAGIGVGNCTGKNTKPTPPDTCSAGNMHVKPYALHSTLYRKMEHVFLSALPRKQQNAPLWHTRVLKPWRYNTRKTQQVTRAQSVASPNPKA